MVVLVEQSRVCACVLEFAGGETGFGGGVSEGVEGVGIDLSKSWVSVRGSIHGRIDR